MHSSVVPMGLPAGVAAGCITYHACHSLGADSLSAVVIAKWAGVTVNVAVGGVKNVFCGDLISLLTVRPVSAVASGWAIAAMYAGVAT